jgi:cell division protein FtsQ
MIEMAREAALILPGDVRLMNAVALAIFALASAALLAAALLWLTRSPLFTIRSITLGGELTRHSVATVRANVASSIGGNFFAVDLERARAAFEALPWVRKAVVRRVWPDRLAVQIEEHRAAAVWSSELRGDRLVNEQGEVFEANAGEVEQELPIFAGPEGSAAQMLAMHRALAPVFARLGAAADTLQLSERGSWRAWLDNGAVIELGRGSEADVLARCERFVATVAEVTARWRQPLEYADLRHPGGYAVRLRGVTTGASAPKTTH